MSRPAAPAPPPPVLAPTPVDQWPPPTQHAPSEVFPWDIPVERVPLGERLRRLTLVLAGSVVVGAACTAAPWIAVGVLVIAVWLLRSGSLAASRVEERRQARGRRWYDGPQLLVHTPWHLVQSIPGTVMLVLWSTGLAAAVGLICFAFAAPVAWSLFGSGVVLALSLWWGPGGSRVRSPLGRLVDPASRATGTWLVTLAILLGLGLGLGLLVMSNDTSWTPAAQMPFQ